MAFQDNEGTAMDRTVGGGVGERSRQPKMVLVGSGEEKRLEPEYHGYGDGEKAG